MKKYTKISLYILLAAIVSGLLTYISYIDRISFPGGRDIEFYIVLIAFVASIILVPIGIIFSLIALRKEEKLLPGIVLSVFLIPVIVFIAESVFEGIVNKVGDKIRERTERTESILSEAYEIMAGKKPLRRLNEPDNGYPVYLLDVALINYNDSIEDGELIFQIEELYVHATYKEIEKMNEEIPYAICKKRVSFTPDRDVNNMVIAGSYGVIVYDISCTDYIYKDNSCTKLEDSGRKYNETDIGHPYDADIYVDLFIYCKPLIRNSEITLIYEETDSLTHSKP